MLACLYAMRRVSNDDMIQILQKVTLCRCGWVPSVVGALADTRRIVGTMRAHQLQQESFLASRMQPVLHVLTGAVLKGIGPRITQHE